MPGQFMWNLWRTK